MTAQEILNELHKLPLPEQAKIAESILENGKNQSAPKLTEEEFVKYLYAKGVISHIPEGMTDEDDDFEPLKVEGEPLSETIIRERR